MYECKCYVLIKFQNDFRKANKFWKLDSYVHIEFFVKYVFINVYHIWISHKQKIISVRNVIFDEQQMWNEKMIKYTIKDIKQFDKTISIRVASGAVRCQKTKKLTAHRRCQIFDDVAPTVHRCIILCNYYAWLMHRHIFSHNMIVRIMHTWNLLIFNISSTNRNQML